jgi:polyhydroxyalkanoate synthesis regulator phasin
MNFKLRNLVAATLAGSFLMGFGANAMADSTTDIVNALVAKGVLTEEEGALLTKGRTDEAAGQAKALKKAGKLKVSDAIDSAELYGDIRVRHEYRSATNQAANTSTAPVDKDRNRDRYKVTFGVKTDAGDWYSDLAFVMGAEGRSDNATFGGSKGVDNAVTVNGQQKKEALFVKRAMVGYKATDWLAVEAGRIANPLYTTEMVWDKDLTLDGAAAKVNFNRNDTKFFLTGAWFQYRGDDVQLSAGNNSPTNNVVVGQAGFETPITEQLKGKAAMSYYQYGARGQDAVFIPTVKTATAMLATGNVYGTNNLQILEVPGELTYKYNDSIGVKLYGDYVVNLDADARSVAANNAGVGKGDDTAWLLGLEVKSQAGKKEAKGDWNAKVWYQETGVYALDPNAVDSDFFDSKINVKGAVFKAQYAASANTFVNFAYGHGSRYNGNVGVTGVKGDTEYNFTSFDLLQLDLTYKF